MRIIVQRCRERELGCAALQHRAFERECVGCRFELCFEVVNHGIEILEMNLSVGVSQPSRITLRTRLEARLELQIVKVGVECAFLVVIVDLTLTEHHVTNTEIEDAGLALAAALARRQIGLAVLCNEDVNDRMIDDDIFQVPLTAEERNDLHSDCKVIDLE